MSKFYTYINEAQISADLKCAICLEPFQLPINDINCRHTYCSKCIEEWLIKNRSCPICRQNVTKFVPMIDQRMLKQLDCLLVECAMCNETNIKRATFKDHITRICLKSIADYDEIDENKHFEYSLSRINGKIGDHRRRRQVRYYEDFFSPLTGWQLTAYLTFCFIQIFLILSIFFMFITIRGILYLVRKARFWT